MAQCPKCNNLIDAWPIVKALHLTWGKSRSFDCPTCDASLRIKPHSNPVSFILRICAALVAAALFIRPSWFGLKGGGLVAGILTAWLILAAVDFVFWFAEANVVEFEVPPPPKKFYDPDRLD
jgi:hypothetical protein